MPERPRPDIDEVREALRRHDEAHEDEPEPAEGEGEPEPAEGEGEPESGDEPPDDD
jgi:hypothetical protein